ncbi:MAG: tetratricopeptide (TPR) repeat protein [Oleiphilaceae bacterium]
MPVYLYGIGIKYLGKLGVSVINDMLRDLDKRQAPEVSASQSLHQESLIEPQSAPAKKLVLIVLVVISLLLVTYFLFVRKSEVSYEQNVMGENSKPSIDQLNNLNLSQASLNEPTQEAISDSEMNNSQAVSSIVSEKSPNSTVSIATKSDPIDLASTNDLNESATQVLGEMPQVSSGIQQEQVKKSVIPKKSSTDRQQKPAEIIPVVIREVVSKAVITKTKITRPKNTIVQPEKIAPILSEKKVMQVRLSPIALDQQMAERALLMISKRQAIEAYRELYAFIGEHEEDMQSRTVLASYLLQENRMAEVGDVLLNAPLERSPKLRQIKARWYAQQGEHKLALYTLNSDLPKIKTYPEYYVLLAAYYQRYGTTAEAKQAYSMLVDYDESVADWWAGLGLASDRNNEKAKAVYAYQQALELKGLSPELLNFVKPRLKQLQASKSKQ